MLVPSNMAGFLFQKSKNKFNSKFSKVFFFLDGEKLVAEEEGGNTYKKP